MIIVREYFNAKPGQASTLARRMKEVADTGMVGKCRVMTDVTGDFNKVVLETEVESLSEFERRWTDYATNEKLKEKMKGYADLYQSGGREIYKVWE